MRVRLAAFISVCLVAGCASKLELKPDTGQSVTVDFAESLNILGATGRIFIYQDDYDCFGFFGYAFQVSTVPITKSIPVNGRKYLTIGNSYFAASLGSTKSCNGIYTFPIEAGARYRLTISNDGVHCYANVSRLASDPAAPTQTDRVEVIQREFQVAVGDGQGPWCKADPAFGGSSSLLVPRGM
jgi:hypothetical protein